MKTVRPPPPKKKTIQKKEMYLSKVKEFVKKLLFSFSRVDLIDSCQA